MYGNYNSHQPQARTLPRLAAGLGMGLALSFLIWPLVTSASPAGQGQSLNPVTIPAGGTANLTVRGFCLDFGKPFPVDNTAPKGLADDKVRAALNYSIQKGYTEGNPAQVELAIWFLRDNTWHSSPHDVAQEIVNNATTANAPPSTGDGVSLSDAVTQNKATVTAKFVAQTAGHFYGDTTLQIKNTGTADLKVFMPVGTVFTVPNGGGKFQDLAAYALGPQGTQQAAPGTATAEPTMTPAPTTTTATAPTATAAAAAPTATTAASAPTATAETAPSTAAATPTAAPTQVSGVLPQTGGAAGADDQVPGLVALMVAVALVALGAALRLKQRKS